MDECRQSQPIIIQPILSRIHNNGRGEPHGPQSTLRRLPSGNNRIRTWQGSTCDITFGVGDAYTAI